MKQRYFKLLLFALLGNMFVSTQAQQQGELLLAPMDVFVPHWQIGGEIGGGFDRGEAKWTKLISPTFQITGAYHFNEYIAARASISGFTSKNEYAFPNEKYSWKFIQPAVEAKLDLASLIFGWNPENKFTPYVFAGLGLAIAFDNDDAVQADKRWDIEFEKLWDGSRFNPVIRGGVGCEYWFTDKTALTLEGNVNMLPDHYNSKKGKNDNRDWRFNAMLGVRFRLGDHNKKTQPVYAEARALQQPVVVEQPPVHKITRAETDLTVNVQFIINQSIIRPSEFSKIQEVITYMNEHPEVHVLLTGYADKETGNPEINERLSRERADAVASFICNQGIASDRVHTDHKGDRIQPYDFPAQNRVCICIVVKSKYL